MRHNKTVKKLSVTRSHRQAMMRNMVTSLLEHGRVTTTHARAKVLRSFAERVITLGKNDTVHSRRMASKSIRSKEIVKKLFNEIAPEFSDRNGGYTRVIKNGFRKGDNAAVSIVELLTYKLAASDAEDKKKDSKEKS